MPGLRLHLIVARNLAGEVGGAIDADRGAYYLGATTPDIRALTRWDRSRTHFFDLDDFSDQSGVHRLFEEHPKLRDAAAMDRTTAAFMAGYISHLVMDEDYITQIYRPLFGQASELRDDALSDVMDKCLQWDVERAECLDSDKVAEIKMNLAEAAVDVQVEFIANETLRQWRDATVDLLGQPQSVERLVRFLGRRLPQFQFDDDAQASKFADEVPALLQRTWTYVGDARVREYLSGTAARARTAMQEYLS